MLNQGYHLRVWTPYIAVSCAQEDLEKCFAIIMWYVYYYLKREINKRKKSIFGTTEFVSELNHLKTDVDIIWIFHVNFHLLGNWVIRSRKCISMHLCVHEKTYFTCKTT